MVNRSLGSLRFRTPISAVSAMTVLLISFGPSQNLILATTSESRCFRDLCLPIHTDIFVVALPFSRGGVRELREWTLPPRGDPRPHADFQPRVLHANCKQARDLSPLERGETMSNMSAGINDNAQYMDQSAQERVIAFFCHADEAIASLQESF